MNMHARTHARTHAHTHTHTQAPVCTRSLFAGLLEAKRVVVVVVVVGLHNMR